MLKFAALQGPAGKVLLRNSRIGTGQLNRIPRVLASSAPILGNTAGSAYSFSTKVASSQEGEKSKAASFETLLPPVLPEASPPQPLTERPSKNWLQKQWERYSFKGQQHRIHTAEAFFQAASRQASDPRWFGPGRILRDFRPRHALLTMHIWFLHKRLIADGLDKEASLHMQEELFNILWDDTTCRIRQQGVNELLVNKHLLQVQQYSFLHLTHYDHAFTEFLDKPEERIKELRKIIWQHVFVRDEDMEDRTDHLDRLAWYVEANYQNILMDWPDEYYREARVAWVDLPDFSGLTDASGKLLEDNPIHPEDELPKPWLRNITLRGIEYYWNPETMRSKWDKPTK